MCLMSVTGDALRCKGWSGGPARMVCDAGHELFDACEVVRNGEACAHGGRVPVADGKAVERAEYPEVHVVRRVNAAAKNDRSPRVPVAATGRAAKIGIRNHE